MKILVLFCALFVFSIFPAVAAIKMDRKDHDLVGPVQMFKEGVCGRGRKPGMISMLGHGRTYNRRGNYETRFAGDKVINTFHYKYNSEGQIVEKLESFDPEITFFIRRRYRHKKNGMTEMTEEDPEQEQEQENNRTWSSLCNGDGDLLEKRIFSSGMTQHAEGTLINQYIYEADGQKKELIRYNDNGLFSGKEVDEYIDIEGGKIEEVYGYDENSKLVSRYQEAYDSHGNRTHSFGYQDLSANSCSYRITYSYVYDDVDNWIMRVKKDLNDPNNGGLATCREITYYTN